MTQIAYTFDKATLTKIGKGALYAIAPAAAIALLEYIGTIQISDPALASFAAWGVPFLINAVKEWAKGVK